jgi:hypothetical protein
MIILHVRLAGEILLRLNFIKLTENKSRTKSTPDCTSKQSFDDLIA